MALEKQRPGERLMNIQTVKTILLACLLTASMASYAETRRDDGGGQASKKAQYMLKVLHREKQELQAQLAKLQADHTKLEKENESVNKKLEKSNETNDMLVERLKDTTNKYKDLASRYRDTIGVLRKANQDNQYMVKAVQEREGWIASCGTRNGELFEANSDLLNRYSEIARDKSNSVFGTGIVQVENEVQEYQFKLEDLQVTKFKPAIDIASRQRELDEGVPEAIPEEDNNIN